MTTEPEQILAEINALLAELPDTAIEGADLTAVDLDAIAARLEEAHDVLVRALESVEKRAGGAGVASPGTDGSVASPGTDANVASPGTDG